MLNVIETGVNLGIACLPITGPPSVAAQEVACGVSKDPNDKVGPRGVGDLGYIGGSRPLHYAVYFENLDTADLAARDVFLTDQLDPVTLDPSSFRLEFVAIADKARAFEFGEVALDVKLDLRPEQDIAVRLETEIDELTGEVAFNFFPIDPVTGEPIPDSSIEGFLPPNVNPPEGEGVVAFSVEPRLGLATETRIANQAMIVFDSNEAIATPLWTNTVDSTPPSSVITPLAVKQCRNDFDAWPWTPPLLAR